MDMRYRKYMPPVIYVDGKKVYLPTMNTLCPVCNGEGKHVNPSIDSEGLTENELGDPEFMDDYMKGVYNVTCNYCKGQKVVKELNEAACTNQELKQYYDDLEQDAADRQYSEMEKRMGA